MDVGVLERADGRLHISRPSPDTRVGEDDFVILFEAVFEAQASAVTVARGYGEVHVLVGYGALVIDVARKDAPLFAELVLDTYTVAP